MQILTSCTLLFNFRLVHVQYSLLMYKCQLSMTESYRHKPHWWHKEELKHSPKPHYYWTWLKSSRSCIGVTGARSFCLTHAPDLESRIDCSSLGSPVVAVEFFAVEFLRLNFLRLNFLRLNYLRLNILTVKNIQIHNFNALLFSARNSITFFFSFSFLQFILLFFCLPLRVTRLILNLFLPSCNTSVSYLVSYTPPHNNLRTLSWSFVMWQNYKFT